METSFTLPTLKFPDTAESMVSRALTVIGENSQGQLTDFSVHSPLVCLVEGLVWTELEYIEVLNQLPQALLLAMLNTYGYRLSLGSASIGEVTVTLSSPIGSSITMPAGWRLTAGSLVFVSTSTLSIPAGSIVGYCSVVSEGTGIVYNVQPGAINAVAPLSAYSPFIATITNTVGTSGGSSAESVEQAILRATALLHSRDALITIPDYETSATSLIGGDGRAIAIPSLGANKIDKEAGAVHVFILNSNLVPANRSQLVAIENAMSLSVVAGTTVYVSEIELFEVYLKVIVRLKDGVSPDDAFDTIKAALSDYLDPFKWSNKRTSLLIKELEYLARDNVFVDTVQGCYLKPENSEMFTSLNIQLPNKYTLPRLVHLTVDMVNNLGEYSYGSGLDPRDTPELFSLL